MVRHRRLETTRAGWRRGLRGLLFVTCLAVSTHGHRAGPSASVQASTELASFEELRQKGWGDGQLNAGEARQPLGKTQSLSGTERRRSSDRASRDDGRIHIGTHEFYTDSQGVRSIDKVLDSYVQGICTNFRSESEQGCKDAGHKWFQCPEEFPHADSSVPQGRAKIPLCYSRKSYAKGGKGPSGSWCVPSHLISYGPQIANQIKEGRGVVCDRRQTDNLARETAAANRETRKYKALKEKYHSEELRKRQLKRELHTEQHQERQQRRRARDWKALAKGYEAQVEDDKASAQVAVDQLQDALNDMDSSSGSGGGGGGGSSGGSSAALSGGPLERNARGARCESPWKMSAQSQACNGTPCASGACRYVRRRCGGAGGLFNYLSLPYCGTGWAPWFGLMLLALWALALCSWLALAAGSFLAPNLTTITAELAMTEAVAGTTLLAFANGAPGVASMVAASVASPRATEMALGTALGSSMFVVCVVLGLVAMQSPVALPAEEAQRDVAFFLAAVLLLMAVLFDQRISIAESAAFAALYVLYIAVVLKGYFVHRARGRGASGEATVAGKLLEAANDSAVGDKGQIKTGAARGMSLAGLLAQLNPLPPESVNFGSPASRMLAGVRAPGLLLMRATCPVPGQSPADQPGWGKEAALLQCVLAPPVLVWAVLLHGLPAVGRANAYLTFSVALVVGALAAGALHVVSRPSAPPAHWRYASAAGFLVAVAWVYCIAVELVHVLQAIGRVVGVSDSFMGLTVLASASSVADLSANLAVARAGLAGMAAAACMGGPLLHLLFGVGLSTLLGNVLVASPFPMELNLEIYTSGAFLAIALTAIFAWLKLAKELPGKAFGLTLLLIYTGFFFTLAGLEAFGGASLLTGNLRREANRMGQQARVRAA